MNNLPCCRFAGNETMKPATKRSVIVLAICAVCTLAFLVLWQRGFVPLQQMEFFAQDWQTRLGRKTPMDDRLVLIGIDKPIYSSDFSDEELQREPVLRDLQNNFPWSRAVWARLIEKLSDAGAKVIVFDLVLPRKATATTSFIRRWKNTKTASSSATTSTWRKPSAGNFRELLLPNASVLTPDGERIRRGRRPARLRQHLAGFRRHVAPGKLPPDRRASRRHCCPETSSSNRSTRGRCANLAGPTSFPPGFDSRLFRYTAPAGLRLQT